MGKSSLIPEIEREVEHLVEEFSHHTNEPNEIPWSLNVAVLNVTWKMVAGVYQELLYYFHSLFS